MTKTRQKTTSTKATASNADRRTEKATKAAATRSWSRSETTKPRRNPEGRRCGKTKRAQILVGCTAMESWHGQPLEALLSGRTTIPLHPNNTHI